MLAFRPSTDTVIHGAGTPILISSVVTVSSGGVNINPTVDDTVVIEGMVPSDTPSASGPTSVTPMAECSG